MDYHGEIDSFDFDYLLDRLIAEVRRDKEFGPGDTTIDWVYDNYPEDCIDQWEGLDKDSKLKVVNDLIVHCNDYFTPDF